MRNHVNQQELRRSLEAYRASGYRLTTGALVSFCTMYFVIGCFCGALLCLVAEVVR